MPIACLASGLQFYYEDSGALDGAYTTLVFIHGTAFTAGIFRRMLPYAPSNRVRLVFLNRRDYPDSSPFSPDELAGLNNADLCTRRTALRRVGLDYGAFLVWFVRMYNTPPLVVHDDGLREGGIVLVAWSLAHSSAAALVACPNELPEDQRAILDEHLRAYCTLDTPSTSFGLPQLSQYHPLTEESIPTSERVPRFERWVSAYYTHSIDALTSHDTSLLDLSPLPYPAPPSKEGQPPTLEAMDAADKQSISWPGPIGSSELFLFTMPPQVLYEHTRLALFDAEAAKVLPRCRFILVWSTQGGWTTISAAWDIERIYNECWHPTRSEVGRPLDVVELPWANHFPHWDEPEKTVQTLASVC
ncbi:hypothetical protein K488DRAFT_51557 [Vararia minispora EC-137]|uniref:Uncharacterized protein n=1 Tax=Vararia minispora EC-137 TaxID=1314806 RepID=A0ACB8QIN3_9AGAM|nr:hypothetical protein K488DRAFT_51557 [Vararia minispora EC-137]